MARTIDIPNFEFSAFYYPEILEALVLFKRANVPELTDESDFEPFMQLLRAFALTGHLNNTLLDLVANEATLPTSRLVETVRNMLRLIDYELSPATPSNTDVVYELARVFTASFELISEDAQAATRASATEVAIPFEALVAQTIARTDELTAVFREDSVGAFTDHTAAANSGAGFSPGLSAAGDKLYWIHSDVMWNKLLLAVTVGAANITGVFEFYDGDFSDIQPDSVTNIGGGILEFDLGGLLGVTNREGATVRVRSNTTGTTEDVESIWTGSANVARTGFLGQTTPSLIASDYQTGVEWQELATVGIGFLDSSVGLTVDGDLTYTLPQSVLLNWQKTTINSVEGFVLRWRTITSTGGSNPTLGRQRIDDDKQYALASVTQGRTVADDPLGSSTGAPNQSFETTRDFFILGSEEVTVDAEVWTKVTDFLNSTSQDKHYRLVLGENDRATIVFGDGNNGRIPPVGAGNISIAYRVDANQDGNVGALAIAVDKTGLSFVTSLFNPRQAGGWAAAQGSTDESLALAKIEGPASLRVKEVAITPDDLIVLAQRFVAADGSKPFSRATYIEEGFGPKTVELILVGSGGVVPTAAHLAELDLFFNGNKFAVPPVEKHFVANQEVTSVSFANLAVDVTATVKAPASVTVAAIQNRLQQVLQPEALKADGVTFEWEFGGDVPVSRLIHEIFETDEQITDVDITLPAADIALGVTQLPTAGTFLITIVEP